MARAYGKIAVGVLRGSPGSVLEGTQSLAAGKWLKERNTTNAMITRAFAKVGRPAGGVNVLPWQPTVVKVAPVVGAAIKPAGQAAHGGNQ